MKRSLTCRTPSWTPARSSQFLLARSYGLRSRYPASVTGISFPGRGVRQSSCQRAVLAGFCSASFPCQDKPFWTDGQESKYMEIGPNKATATPPNKSLTAVQSCANESFPSAFQEPTLPSVEQKSLWLPVSFVPVSILVYVVRWPLDLTAMLAQGRTRAQTKNHLNVIFHCCWAFPICPRTGILQLALYLQWQNLWCTQPCCSRSAKCRGATCWDH